MKISELLKNTDVKKICCDPALEITAVCYDSRQVTEGAAFVAIKGFTTDGHTYIEAAYKQGARAVICEKAPKGNIPYVLVADARKALALVSSNFWGNPQSALTVIGVTGTNGKTTVTNLIKEILAGSGIKCGLIGTNRNMIGDLELPAERTTPESADLQALLAEMRDQGCTHVVMEVSSHSLELDRVHGIEFSVAIFTNLTRDHLDFHGTMDTYFKAKAKLFAHCRRAVVNHDDPAGRKLAELCQCPVFTYSAQSDEGSLVAKNIQLLPDKVIFEAVLMVDICRVSLGIPGLFSVYNAAAAVSACLMLGLDLHGIAEQVKTVGGVKGRAELVPVSADYTVVIDYAHSPDGVANILGACEGFAKERIIAVLGCGGDRDKEKRPMMGAAAAERSDILIVTTDNPRSEDPERIIADILPGTKGKAAEVRVVTDRIEAIHHALSIARTGDVVVLMGKGHETYQEINGKRHHMDEREIVADFFAGKA